MNTRRQTRFAPASEWDGEEEAEETANRTLLQFLAHMVRQLWPLVALAIFIAGAAVWFSHHP
jgi:hypothetical protein